jgi:hypothetical protein
MRPVLPPPPSSFPDTRTRDFRRWVLVLRRTKGRRRHPVPFLNYWIPHQYDAYIKPSTLQQAGFLVFRFIPCSYLVYFCLFSIMYVHWSRFTESVKNQYKTLPKRSSPPLEADSSLADHGSRYQAMSMWWHSRLVTIGVYCSYTNRVRNSENAVITCNDYQASNKFNN